MKETVHSYIAIVLIFFFGFLFFNNIPHVRASTLYYNAAVDTDWNTAGNWWADAGFTVPGSVPIVSDDVVIEENVNSNGGPAASVNTMIVNGTSSINIPVTVANGATFNGSSINANTISGNASFNDSTHNQGTVSGDATFSDSSFSFGTISGNATFNDLSYSNGTVSGNAVFNYASGGTITLSGSQAWGVVSGTVKGNDAVLITEYIFNDISDVVNIGIVSGNATFNNSSANFGTVSGNATFNESGTNTGTVSGNAIFNGTNNNNGAVSLDAVFNDSTVNIGTISGNATFNDSSYNVTTVSGNAVFNYASGGTITINDSQVWGNVGGTSKGSDAVLITEFIFNGASYSNGAIPGNATFNDTSYNDNAVSGNATFNNSSYNNNTVSGNATFNNSSYNNVFSGIISGNATFNDSSHNGNAVSGDATFNNSSYNNGNVSGNATFNDSSYNNGFIFTNASFFDSTINQNVVFGNACFAATADPDGGSVGGTTTACSATAPSVTTDSATILSASSVQLFGTITDTGGESASPAGFQYGHTTSYGNTVSLTGPFVRGTFNNTVSSLTDCGPYHFRVFATNSAGTGYGSDLTFTVRVCSSGGGRIEPTPTTCTPPKVLVNNVCTAPPPPTCIPPQVLVNGVCTTPTPPPTCTSPQVLQNGTCVTPKPKPIPLPTPTPTPTPTPSPTSGTTTPPTTPPSDTSPGVDVNNILESALETTRNFTKNPFVKTFENIAVSIPIAFSFLALINSLMSGIPLLNHSFYSSVVILQLLGFRRKPKPWGTVYDSVTKRPLPFVRVEILNEQSRRLQSTVADANGRYGFLISSQLPNIQLRAYLEKYDFPSKEEPSVVEQKLYPNIYKGGIVNASSDLTNFDLPMDPRDKSTAHNFYFGISSIKLNNILTKSADILFVLGTILGITNAILNPSVISYSVLAVIVFSFILRTSGLKLKSFGLTKDIETNKSLPFGLIALHNQGGERLNFTVSDDKGRYFLLTPKGNYTLKAYTPSHISPTRTKEIPISTRKGWISREVTV